MSYRIALTNAAKRGLRHVNPELQRRIAARLQELKQTPRPSGVAKLSNREKQWRIRVGDYRIIYEIDEGERLVTVLSIAHRREAYR